MKHIIAKLFHAVAPQCKKLLRDYRSMILIVTQLILIVVANLSAFLLRFDADILPQYQMMMWRHLPLVLLVFSSGLWVLGIQRGLWRYVDLHDLGKIFLASLAGALVFYGVTHLLLGHTEYPRSIIILTGLLSGVYLVWIRLAVHWFRKWFKITGQTTKRVLVIGAGNAGELLVQNMLSNPNYNSKPVAFVDDDPMKRKMKIHGISVLGTTADIKAVVDRVGAHEIILAIPSAPVQLKQKILAMSEGCIVPIKILPSIKRLLSAPVLLQHVRPMNLDDLLQRELIETDCQALYPLIKGKTVLVTGAGGSIGSELCRQIVQYKPESLVLFEQYENSLHTLLLELRAADLHTTVFPVVGDVTMSDRVSEVFRRTGPDLVFHAAAHKHVPLMELNLKEAVRNNILGTRVVAEAALKTGVDRFVLISTDKAVNPSSVMGVTKRIAEYVVQEFSHKSMTKFTVVRFGNVLGSNGSVVPLFAEQIRKGGPVTVTDPEIKRFFMTIPEAVQLVLQASVMGQGGEVFVLDMGEQIRIADLARNMIVLSGLVPERDIAITYTGLRPGEKLYEELFEVDEEVAATSHPKINRAMSKPLSAQALDRWMEELSSKLSSSNDGELLQDLKRLVPNFNPLLPDRVS